MPFASESWWPRVGAFPTRVMSSRRPLHWVMHSGEYRHEFLHRPYLKADGMPASYSPDFIVRTADKIFIVETKAQSALSDENVQRKQRAAISWVDQINTLDSEDRSEREWPTYYSGSKQ